MTNPIIDFINSNFNLFSDAYKYMPFVHSCEGFSLEGIIEEGELKTVMCPVFKKEYLYLFYGKPSYSVGQKIEGTRTDLLYCPCCLIFKNSNINIHKVFPFDSGGFMNNIYKDYFHPKMNIDKFELENSLDGIKKFISVFFEDNDEYIKGIAKRIKSTNAYVDSLINLLSAEGNNQMDERSRTIEIITDNNINIKDELLGIVMPKNLLRSEKINNFIKENDIKCETYFFRPLTRPVEYNQVVFDKVMNIIEGYI